MRIENSSGKIANFVDDATLAQWVSMFNRIAHNLSAANGADVYNITSDQVGWRWLEKTVFSRLRPLFGDDVGLIFAQYQSSEHPIKIHNDFDVDLPEGVDGEPHVSMLIPISVDHGEGDIANASTIVLEPGHDPKLHEQHLSHCDPDKVAQFQIRDRHVWEKGSLIWWHAPLQHCSNKYLVTNRSKESIVMHLHHPKVDK